MLTIRQQTFGAMQRPRPRYCFAVVAYRVRPDNRRTPRLFRYLTLHDVRHEALDMYRCRIRNPGFLYVVLIDMGTADAVAEWGSDQVEEQWLNTTAQRDWCRRGR